MLVTKDGVANQTDYRFIEADVIDDDSLDLAVDCPVDQVSAKLVDALDRVSMIRIPFADTSDGRGFSIAARLRQLGYRGLLRAHGKVISDQFRFAVECGFDEVFVVEEIAARQPREMWGFEARESYRQRLGIAV